MPFSLRRWIASIDTNPYSKVKLETIDLSTYCRTCLNETIGTDFYMLDSTDNVTLGNETLEQILRKLIGVDSGVVSTYHCYSQWREISTKIHIILIIQVEHAESVQPERICLSCCELLTRYYVFRNECLQSHNTLLKYRRLMSRQSNGNQIESVPPSPPRSSVTNTTTFIELKKDTSTFDEAPVVINVKVENDEFIIDTVVEEGEEDDDNNGDQPDEEERDNDPTYGINEQPFCDLMDDDDDGTDGEAQNDIIQPSSAISKEEKRRVIVISHQKIAKKQLLNVAGDQSDNPKLTPQNQNVCPLCDCVFTYHKTFARHLNDHMPDNKCPFCDRYFARKYVLRRHLQTHSGKTKYFKIDDRSKSSSHSKYRSENYLVKWLIRLHRFFRKKAVQSDLLLQAFQKQRGNAKTR